MKNPRLLKKIKVLLLDVDGVMTDGRMFFDGKDWRRLFNIKDGAGIKFLQKEGYKVGIITGSKAEDIRARSQMLGLDFFYEGVLDKIPALLEISKSTGFALDEIAYVGDDLFDIPVLEKVGFPVTVSDAIPAVKKKVKYVTKNVGGHAAVREVCDILFKHGNFAGKK